MKFARNFEIIVKNLTSNFLNRNMNWIITLVYGFIQLFTGSRANAQTVNYNHRSYEFDANRDRKIDQLLKTVENLMKFMQKQLEYLYKSQSTLEAMFKEQTKQIAALTDMFCFLMWTVLIVMIVLTLTVVALGFAIYKLSQRQGYYIHYDEFPRKPTNNKNQIE